ncbi:MAG: ATP-binding protein [Saprospiraceae bacterium]
MKSINQLQQSIGIYCRLQLFLPNLRVFIFPNRNAYLLSLLLLLTGLNNRLLAFEDAKELWPLIQTQLDESGADTARQFIFLLVRGHCGDNYHCLYPAYSVVKEKVERRFDLSTAIEICREMLKIAHQQGDLNGEAHAHSELARYYSALGDEKEAVINTEKAWSLYEQAGNHRAINKIKLMKLENRIPDQDIQEVLPDMEKLLAELIEMKDTNNMNYLNLRLIHYTQWAGEFELMAKHVAAAEKGLVPEPSERDDYWFAIHTFRGRAYLAWMDQDLEEAEQFYQKALQYSIAMPDYWLEIRTLHSLAELEMERGRNDLAIGYLDSAQIKAEALEMEDLLTANFNLKATIAELEGRYADALVFTKKKLEHEEKLKSKSANFDLKNFYLEKEKEQLAAEKEKQELELKIKNGRLRNLINIIGLGILLIVALGLSLYMQRQSKRKLAVQNELIQKQAERLANLDAAKSRFFANVSHELRTPLSLLLGPISQLIKENKLNERQNRLLNMASESGKQLGQLVNEILDLGKMEMGKMGLEQKPTKLAAFFHHYLLQFESLAYRKQVDFTFDLTMDPNLTALIDQAKCRQVLYNLLSNAFKFTPEGGAIKASFFVNDNMVCMEVADSGPGIHPDDLPHVFDRYFQTNQSGQPASGGSGIGLALCHEYAQLFGGNISVNSQLGNGAVFRFEFPVETVSSLERSENSELTSGSQLAVGSGVAGQLVEWKEVAAQLHDPESDKRKIEKPAVPTHQSKPTLLVVEDNLELQDYIRLILEEKYNVLTAENGGQRWIVSSAVRQSDSPTVFSPSVGSPVGSRQSGNQIEAQDCRTGDCRTAELKTVELQKSTSSSPT